jgi:hypothetical protein
VAILNIANLFGLIIDAYSKEKSADELNNDSRATFSLNFYDLIVDVLIMNFRYAPLPLYCIKRPLLTLITVGYP